MQNKLIRILDNPSLEGCAAMIPDIVYSNVAGEELKLQILKPWIDEQYPESVHNYPLVVFIQGSAWTTPNVYSEIPQLGQLAQKGFIVASVSHRSRLDGYPAPAYLEDVKTAIRFLRKNAEMYNIDTDHVCAWGTSSGGNTSLLLGLTGDDDRYKTSEYTKYSDSVNSIVDCFGPADMLSLSKQMDRLTPEEYETFKTFVGADNKNPEKILIEMSPYHIVEKGKNYPPFLMLHGNKDDVVDYSQSEKLFQRFTEYGVSANMVCVENAPHEGTFWSQKLLDIVMEFIRKTI